MTLLRELLKEYEIRRIGYKCPECLDMPVADLTWHQLSTIGLLMIADNPVKDSQPLAVTAINVLIARAQELCKPTAKI